MTAAHSHGPPPVVQDAAKTTMQSFGETAKEYTRTGLNYLATATLAGTYAAVTGAVPWDKLGNFLKLSTDNPLALGMPAKFFGGILNKFANDFLPKVVEDSSKPLYWPAKVANMAVNNILPVATLATLTFIFTPGATLATTFTVAKLAPILAKFTVISLLAKAFSEWMVGDYNDNKALGRGR